MICVQLARFVRKKYTYQKADTILQHTDSSCKHLRRESVFNADRDLYHRSLVPQEKFGVTLVAYGQSQSISQDDSWENEWVFGQLHHIKSKLLR